MKIRFNYPLGSEGWTKDIRMPAAPRVGEEVLFENNGDDLYLVRSVTWTPDDRFAVYIVLTKGTR